jgi:hypothetical protein
MTYRGQVKGGVIVPDPGVNLPEGTVVSIAPLPFRPEQADDPMFRMGDLAAETGVTDLAANVDHYLYGHPKVDNAGKDGLP